MKNYNGYSYDYPTVTEAFANKMKAEKENARRLIGTPEEISAAVRKAMKKSADSLITATPSTVREAVSAQLELLRGNKCA